MGPGQAPPRPSSPSVTLPRWVLALLVAACAAGLAGVAFLLGRATAPAPALAPQAAAVGSDSSLEAPPTRAPEDVEAAAAGEELDLPASASPAPLTDVPLPETARGLRPAARRTLAAIAAYFAQVDALGAQARAAQDPRALAQGVLDQALSGNMSGVEGLIATQRALQEKMAEILPPPSCREHHQRSLRLIGRAIALLERTRDAVAGKSPSDLGAMATEGRAIEEEARATDALANDLRRAAGLPPVP